MEEIGYQEPIRFGLTESSFKEVKAGYRSQETIEKSVKKSIETFNKSRENRKQLKAMKNKNKNIPDLLSEMGPPKETLSKEIPRGGRGENGYTVLEMMDMEEQHNIQIDMNDNDLARESGEPHYSPTILMADEEAKFQSLLKALCESYMYLQSRKEKLPRSYSDMYTFCQESLIDGCIEEIAHTLNMKPSYENLTKSSYVRNQEEQEECFKRTGSHFHKACSRD